MAGWKSALTARTAKRQRHPLSVCDLGQLRSPWNTIMSGFCQLPGPGAVEGQLRGWGWGDRGSPASEKVTKENFPAQGLVDD